MRNCLPYAQVKYMVNLEKPNVGVLSSNVYTHVVWENEYSIQYYCRKKIGFKTKWLLLIILTLWSSLYSTRVDCIV